METAHLVRYLRRLEGLTSFFLRRLFGFARWICGLMSLRAKKRTSQHVRAMSALPPIAEILNRRAVIRSTIAMFTPCKERHRAVSACPARHSAPDIIHGLLKGTIATMTQRADRVPIQVTGEIQYDAPRHCAYEVHS